MSGLLGSVGHVSMLSGPAIALSFLLLGAGIAVWLRMRSRSQIALAAIITIGLSPLVALFLLWNASERDPFPDTWAEGQLQLTQELPIAIVDTEITLTGGTETGLAANLYAFGRSVRGHPLAESWTIRLDESDSATHSGSLRINKTCTDCTYRFRTAFALDPTADARPNSYEMQFSWDPDRWEWDVDTEDLPTVTMESHLVDDIAPSRVRSNEIHETTSWRESRPFDLRLITVLIDEAVIPETGLGQWPAIEQTYTILGAYEGDELLDSWYISRVAELNEGCLTKGCPEYAYVLPIITPDWVEPEADRME
ncbi:MAG: hypothetical protein QNL12_11750 [Acidimicrobiia bacterium]|nr:hypothetical protein [Acidimicrobiia bacterium]MDX2467981.1 hypothetical protein [Acidimicrobiia bacterium]